MGCGGSKEAVVEAEVLQSRAAPISVGNVGAATGSTFGTGDIDINDVHNVLSIHESHDTKDVGHQTFLASVLEARSKHSKDASVLRTACLRLKEYNQKLKDFVAIQDAQTVKEASEGVCEREREELLEGGAFGRWRFWWVVLLEGGALEGGASRRAELS